MDDQQPNRRPAEPPRSDDDDRDPADRAPSWSEAGQREHDPPETAAQTPKETQDEWDRLLDEADAPAPSKRDPRDHPDVPDSARRMLRDDTSAG